MKESLLSGRSWIV